VGRTIIVIERHSICQIIEQHIDRWAQAGSAGRIVLWFLWGLVPEVVAMCDYSLHNVASRPAEVGDKLVTTQFFNSGTRGFSAIGEPNVAVCLLPGTEVAFENDVELDGGLGFFLNWKRSKVIGAKVARFRQIHMDKPYVHHDALEFPDGQTVMVTRLIEGQRARVLQLPASPQGRAHESRRDLVSLNPVA
jgi:hypothetical protein